MRIVCIGGGPAGLYFALLAKRRHPEYEIAVLERAASASAQGWGVTYTESMLDRLHRHDPVSAREVRERSVLWRGLHVRLPDGRARIRGYGFAIARAALLEILAGRAEGLGVQLRYRSAVHALDELGDVDLVVAADGAGSAVRGTLREKFGTQVESGRNLFAWLGTDQVLEGLTFVLQRTPAGPVWMHGYPSVAGTSTCIVECSERTHRQLRLDSMCVEEAMAALARIFADVLGGRSLLPGNAAGGSPHWRRFEHVRNAHWHHGNVVLLGDAAHTTHFSIGAGTEEAIRDATALARSLHEHRDVPEALAAYETRRRVPMEELQLEAKHSMELFERIETFAHLDPVAFVGVLEGSNDSLASSGLRGRLTQTWAVQKVARRSEAAAVRANERRWARQTSTPI